MTVPGDSGVVPGKNLIIGDVLIGSFNVYLLNDNGSEIASFATPEYCHFRLIFFAILC